ncbi:hypothetical protein D915_001246 [Fasciola hepatica]|uniref:Uncharacterized protein n=1 Tax=Fasciola hepatica TaxID=6192 RepID=A0A4E0RME2_FASHE|nr:hypothetical protein D915_001246 [Fasciola hepatica]
MAPTYGLQYPGYVNASSWYVSGWNDRPSNVARGENAGVSGVSVMPKTGRMNVHTKRNKEKEKLRNPGKKTLQPVSH